MGEHGSIAAALERGGLVVALEFFGGFVLNGGKLPGVSSRLLAVVPDDPIVENAIREVYA